MRKTFLYLMACLVMYCVYMNTLDFTAAETTPAAAQPRISARISLPKVRMYAVSLGNFDSETEARPRAAAWAVRGAAGRIIETDSGYEVLGAMFDSEAEAASVCSRLSAGEDIPARVILYSAEGMDISITATQSQSEAITDALTIMTDYPVLMLSLAAQVDSGQCTPETARSLISIMYTDAVRTRERLSDELGATADIFSRMVETGLMDMCASLGSMCGDDAPGGLMLSSLMKQCAIDTTLYIINMQNTLSR